MLSTGYSVTNEAPQRESFGACNQITPKFVCCFLFLVTDRWAQQTPASRHALITTKLSVPSLEVKWKIDVAVIRPAWDQPRLASALRRNTSAAARSLVTQVPERDVLRELSILLWCLCLLPDAVFCFLIASCAIKGQHFCYFMRQKNYKRWAKFSRWRNKIHVKLQILQPVAANCILKGSVGTLRYWMLAFKASLQGIKRRFMTQLYFCANLRNIKNKAESYISWFGSLNRHLWFYLFLVCSVLAK